jgi:hypothetical protein
MTANSKPTKKAVAAKPVKSAAKNPKRARTVAKAAVPVAKAAGKIGKRVAKRRARRHVEHTRHTARQQVETGLLVGQTAAELVAIYGPILALAFGLADPPKHRNEVPQLVGGIVIGAAAVYFFGPRRTPERAPR